MSASPGAGETHPGYQEMFLAFLRIGLLSFGGPAAQISLMHRILVEEKTWLAERQYLNALSFCMLLPGPEAMQLATYAGWRLRGTLGGLMAGLLFVLPGAIVVLALAITYAKFQDVSLIATLFLGVKAAVLIIVIEALLRVARRALKRTDLWVLAALSFVGIFFLGLPYPLIVLLAALYGALRGDGLLNEAPTEARIGVSVFQTVVTIVIWGLIWWVPQLALSSWADGSILVEIADFFSKLAVVTFGGAYAVLAYMGQEVVTDFGWLTAGEMMDGLGLAETTPGPLILMTEFVGFVAAYKSDGLLVGLAGAAVAIWVTFAPCFLWIFAGAPYIEWITAQRRLNGALMAITAAVVGVIANLSVWFSLHVLFAEVSLKTLGPVQLWVPDLSTIDWKVPILAVVCGVLLLKQHWGIASVLAVSASLGWLLTQTGV